MRFSSSRFITSRIGMAIGMVAVAAPLALAASPALAQDATATPGVIGTPVATDSCDLSNPSFVPEGAAATYVIDSGQSLASYHAEEELAQIGKQTATGSTNAFIGQLAFDSNGLPMECSRFDVDLRTLTSDESRRDNFLYSNVLETGTYPLATFILTSVEGMGGALTDGQEIPVTLIGNLTIHGVTNQVSWDATVKLDGDNITGHATTNFTLDQYNMQKPIVGPVISIADTIQLEVSIVAAKA
jgi:polyisoprenoid-binding protein YceI